MPCNRLAWLIMRISARHPREPTPDPHHKDQLRKTMGGCQSAESAPPPEPVKGESFRKSVGPMMSLRRSISSFAGLSTSSAELSKPVPPPMPSLVINEVQNVPTSKLSRLQAGTKVSPPVPSAPRRSASTPPSLPPLRSHARARACQTLGRPSPYAALTPSPRQNTYIEVTVSCGKRLAATCYTSAFKACDTEWNAIVDVEMAVHRVLTRAGFPEVTSARAAALAPAVLRPSHATPPP